MIQPWSVIEFPNGYTIHVHEIWHGEVLYQLWPPGVTEQRWPTERCYRKPLAQFEQEVVEHGGVLK